MDNNYLFTFLQAEDGTFSISLFFSSPSFTFFSSRIPSLDLDLYCHNHNIITMKSFSIGSLLVSSLALFAGDVRAQRTAASDCSQSLHSIYMRGEGPDSVGGEYNVLAPLAEQIMSALPGSSAIAIPFDHADQDKLFAAYNASVMFNQYIQDYVESCPNTPIFALGYSLGADGMMNSLCGSTALLIPPSPTLDPKYKSNSQYTRFLSFFLFFFFFFFLNIFWHFTVVLIGIFADETYVSGQPWNTGNCTNGKGVGLLFLFVVCSFPQMTCIADFTCLFETAIRTC